MFTTLLGAGLNIILDPIFLFVCKWGIHDKPDIGFDATDFYVGFIGSKDFSCIVIVVVYEWFDADSNCLTEVSYLLVGYVNVVKFF